MNVNTIDALNNTTNDMNYNNNQPTQIKERDIHNEECKSNEYNPYLDQKLLSNIDIQQDQ